MSEQKESKFALFLKMISSLFSSGLPEPVLMGLVGVAVLEAIKGIKPTEEEQEDIYKRAQQASNHLKEAGEILTDLQVELGKRSSELEKLLADIDARQDDAEQWTSIAAIKEGEMNALMKQIEQRLREQIKAELEKNKVRRRIIGFSVWIFTLVAGGFVGFFIQKWLGGSS